MYVHSDVGRITRLTQPTKTGKADARDFYETCQYLGNVEITARMFDVRRERLVLGEEPHYAPIQEQESLDREIFASTECYARDLIEPNKSTNAIVDLVGQLLWGFNVNDGTWEKQVRTMIEKWK